MGLALIEVASAIASPEVGMVHDASHPLWPVLNARRFGTKTKIADREAKLKLMKLSLGPEENMHRGPCREIRSKSGASGKAIVQGILDRTARNACESYAERETRDLAI